MKGQRFTNILGLALALSLPAAYVHSSERSAPKLPKTASEISNVDGVVGAKVFGPGPNAFGIVRDTILDSRTGEVAMYLVESYGWFEGEGVIPVSDVVSITPDESSDELRYQLKVGVNKSTFRNIAKWNGEGDISSYLRHYSSILATVYGMDKDNLETSFNLYKLNSETDKSLSDDIASN